MSNLGTALTTGSPGLDHVLKGILPGDNIVWHVDAVEDYAAVVKCFAQAAVRSGRKLIYFRFANHAPLICGDSGIEIHKLDPAEGFETFIAKIHAVIETAGRGALYIFDCMSELAADWYSDTMLGNFFVLTCPYLYDLETVAYFALFRNRHGSRAIRPITETTQLFVELYRHSGRLYLHPLKVQFRYSSTMNLLHIWEGDEIRPVTSSVEIAPILMSVNWSDLNADSRPDFWERIFEEARNVHENVKAGRESQESEKELFDHLCRMMISRDPKMLELVAEYLTLEDALGVWRRMIGSGLVGGKTVGMLIARNILKRHSSYYAELLEDHDSFYVGSDVFYTYLVQNGVWWLRQKQRNARTFLEGAVQARQRILLGNFPPDILKQFEQMLDYFGQSPIIVRSSSLLEDSYGNSFAGKYDSVFCPNQGPRERRLEDFLTAVRTIYASTMSEKALRYREQRGLLNQDEQMALLVMRVSGEIHGRYYYPQAAGVGFSFNPYVWHETIDPKAGVLRLVFGLGTRAVDRVDDDYTRLVALNAPQRRPEANFEEIRDSAQRRVDYLDLQANQLASGYFPDVIADSPDVPVEMFATADPAMRDMPGRKVWVPTFDALLSQTDFVKDMRGILAVLQEAYQHPVDVEFTMNFTSQGAYKIHIVQCRPLAVKGSGNSSFEPVEVADAETLIKANTAVLGQSRRLQIEHFVYVVPSAYARLGLQDRYQVARLLGDINRADSLEGRCIMLLGPGRWGTADPFLGVPVVFPEISRVSVLCEIVAMHEHLTPDVSLGTHFLNELVERDILYLAVSPGRQNTCLQLQCFENAPNHLRDLAPRAAGWEEVIKIIDAGQLEGEKKRVFLDADAFKQQFICYRHT